jgi:hypothetical protein
MRSMVEGAAALAAAARQYPSVTRLRRAPPPRLAFGKTGRIFTALAITDAFG